MIECRGLCAGYKKKEVLHDISFTVPKGTVIAAVGKNGSGKSTLAACLLGVLPLRAGSICLNGKPLPQYTRQELARMVSFTPQNLPAPAVSVEELIGFGRAPYTGISGRLSPEDKAAVEKAAALCGMTELLERMVTGLSGGERQRAYLAMALAQEAPVMVLDEPSASLDIGARSQFLQLLQRLARETGRTVVVITHDLSDAVTLADHLLVLEEGRAVYTGPAGEDAAAETLERVFSVRRHVFEEDGQQFTIFTAK